MIRLRAGTGAALVLTVMSAGAFGAAQARPPAAGTIVGRVRLTGNAPGNAVIRMGVDPLCSKANAGRRVFQRTVVASRDGGLADVFVRLEGRFTATPVPADPVIVDQQACIYLPRVIGARTGQTLLVKNSDALLHNVHALSTGGNPFNVGQPLRGQVFRHQLKEEAGMLRLKCDVHRWMTAYIGVVDHPYFAVTDSGGSFTIRDVPTGTRTVRAWHERYGELTVSVKVTSGATATAYFAYSGLEKTPPPQTP